mmetsp:Transcript_22852/g.52321  ORF Transcript_22852/g.52321 Transcript_22852/m.52321 type:complete len:306 (-) Transcript_22852:13-930(-)
MTTLAGPAPLLDACGGIFMVTFIGCIASAAICLLERRRCCSMARMASALAVSASFKASAVIAFSQPGLGRTSPASSAVSGLPPRVPPRIQSSSSFSRTVSPDCESCREILRIMAGVLLAISAGASALGVCVTLFPSSATGFVLEVGVETSTGWLLKPKDVTRFSSIPWEAASGVKPSPGGYGLAASPGGIAELGVAGGEDFITRVIVVPAGYMAAGAKEAPATGVHPCAVPCSGLERGSDDDGVFKTVMLPVVENDDTDRSPAAFELSPGVLTTTSPPCVLTDSSKGAGLAATIPFCSTFAYLAS